MSDGPKLFTNKPRKAQLKHKTEEGRPLSQSSMDPPRPSETPPPPSSAQIPKETATRRYKFVWPVLLAVNVAIGGEHTLPYTEFPSDQRRESETQFSSTFISACSFANLQFAYLFLNANKKDEKEVAEVVGGAPASTASATVAVPEKKTLPPEPTIATAIPREPIPEDEQRKLFKWMLEEKRKVKAKNSEEKKQTDEDKAILKQFIRAKSLPTI